MSTDIPSTAASSRSGCVMPAFILLFAVAVLSVAFLGSTCISGGTGSGTYETPLTRLRPDDPVFVSTKGLYVVRLGSGEVLALDSSESRREDVINGCVIRYRETLQAAGRTGVFRSDCTGTLYDLTGTPIEGSGAPMKRHPVIVSKTTVTVDLTRCTEGRTGMAVPCRPL